MSPSVIALIPARAGSKRIPHKNTKRFGDRPLIEWTLEAARKAGIFDRIIVSSDVHELELEEAYGAEIHWRSRGAGDADADIVWVRDVLEWNAARPAPRSAPDAFAILRPTSPFRSADTIRRAWQTFLDHPLCDSLRAVQPVTEHPGKMWTYDAAKSLLLPIMPYRHPDGTPWHSSPTQTLKPVYVQNASLEIAWTKTIRETDTISGTRVCPFFTEGMEGFDLNIPEDWARGERFLDGVLA